MFRKLQFYIMLLVFFQANLLAQELINNNGFEQVYHCPNTLGDFYAKGWFATHATRTTPDLYSTCAEEDVFASPKNFIINVKPFQGENYVGFVAFNPHENYREYISTKLASPLVKDKVYRFSITLSQPEMSLYYIGEIGAVFSSDSLNAYKLSPVLVAPPDIKIAPKNLLECRNSWTTYSINYKALGGERYIHLGCFASDEYLIYRMYKDRLNFSNNTGYRDAYYLMDSISLSEVIEEVTAEPFKTFTFDQINFNTGDFSSAETEFLQFAALLEFLKSNPNLSVLIEGHTDDVGDAKDNQLLSEERALFVRSYFESKGIQNKINTKGYGEDQPLYPNDNKENRSKNRRVVIKLYD